MSTRRFLRPFLLASAVFIFAIFAGLPIALAEDASPPATDSPSAAVVVDASPVATATAAAPDPVAAVATLFAALSAPPAPTGLPPEVALIGVLATLAVAALKKYAPNIPGPWLPFISTSFGLLIELGLSKAGITHGIGWLGGLAGGVAGVGIREHVDQLKKATGLPAINASISLFLAIGLIAGTALVGSGCTSYRHQRFSDTGQPIETTSLSAPFLTKTALQNLRTATKEKRGTNTYSRSVGLDGAESRVDAEGVDAIGATVGRLLIEGLKASSGAGALIPSAAPAPRAAAQPAYQAPPPEVAVAPALTVAPAALRTVAAPAPASPAAK